MSGFYWTARKKATYDKFGEDGLKGGIPLDAINTAAWSTQYVYHGKPEKTFTQFFGGDNPFAGETDDPCSSQVDELMCCVCLPDFQMSDMPPQPGQLQPGVVKTQDPQIERDLHLSLDDLYLGCTKKIKISRRVGPTRGNRRGRRAQPNTFICFFNRFWMQMDTDPVSGTKSCT